MSQYVSIRIKCVLLASGDPMRTFLHEKFAIFPVIPIYDKVEMDGQFPLYSLRVDRSQFLSIEK